MIKMHSNRRRALTGIAALILVAGVVGATMTAARPDDRVPVTALFDNASAVVPGNEVKAAGVTVGEVESIELDGGRARVEMRVERSVLPLHQDAAATITDKDLLGERFITLERGTAAKPLLDAPAVIPPSQTGRVVDLQSILDAVDDPTGTALAALLTTLGEGADGLGPDIAAGIKAIEPAMRRADELGQVLDDQNELLTRLVDSAAPVADALAAGRGKKLDRLIGSAERTMATVAAERKAVRETLERLPATLASAQRTLANVAGVADNATPMLASMRPITDDLTDISGELRRFADAADPALASMEPVLKRAKAMLDEAAPVVRALKPAGPDLVGVADAGHTLTKDAVRAKLGDLMEFVRGWALSTTQYDGLSHYFRAAVPLTPKALGHLAGGPVPGAPENPVPDLPLPRVPLPPPLGSEDGGKGATEGKPADSATGLTEKQENALLGQLLGGR